MKKIFSLSAGIFLFTAFFVFQAKAETIVPDGVTHADSDNVDMKVNADSTINVTETVNYNYGNQTNPGWTRYIPLNYQDLSGSNTSIEVSDVTVTDQNNSPYDFKQFNIQSDDKKQSYLAIAMDYENQSFSGSKYYIIRYTVTDAIKFGGDHDELFWNATGNKWPVYVRYPEVTITLPQKVDSSQMTKECFIGIHKATMECIDRIGSQKDLATDYSYKGVVAGEGITTVLDFPKGIVQKKVIIQPTFWGTLKSDRKAQEVFLFKALCLLAVVLVVAKYFKKIALFLKSEKFYRVLVFIGKKFQLHHVHRHAKKHAKKLKNKSRKWWITLGVILTILVLLGTYIFWKIDITMNKISVKGESVGSIVQAGLPNQSQIKGESDGRINVLLLGILGADHQGGGLNTDTIMVASLEPKDNKLSLISIPRDLWVTDPGKDTKSKINAVYEYGEEKGPGQGIADMENMVGQITGIQIDYTAVVSTQGFSQLVDAVGGVDVNLTKPFDESAQFADVSVCDTDTFTVPTGQFQTKTNKKGKVTAQYPLCKNATPECGGDFHLPVGKNTLSGSQALCFVRSRYETSDFERAKRQQLLIQQLKQKVTQLGFNEFGKINSILDTLGNNVQNDMQLWEMRRLFDLYNGMNSPQIFQRVLEDSKQGLLYSPQATPETGYILLPTGDDYSQIQKLFQNVFTDTSNQTDIKPQI